MKFSIAVAALGQALPVVSESKISSWLAAGAVSENESIIGTNKRRNAASDLLISNEIHQNRMTRMRDALIRRREKVALRNEGTMFDSCDPTSNDPDTGVLSCGMDRICKANSEAPLGGICSSTFPGHSKLQNLEVDESETETETGVLLNNAPDFCDPDLGILGCGAAQRCVLSEDSPLGGKCQDKTQKARFQKGSFKNSLSTNNKLILQAGQKNGAKPCDPTAPDVDADVDVDVGVLGCDLDEVCVESTTSEMGGLCTKSAPRRLQYSNFSLYCDPNNADYDCDCAAFDLATYTGSIQCNTIGICVGCVVYGCTEIDGTVSSTFTYESGDLTSVTNFYNFTSSNVDENNQGVSQTVEVSFPADDSLCEVEFNGVQCTSCVVGFTPFFECSNVDGGVNGTLAEIPLLDECSRPVYGIDCNVCGYYGTAYGLDSDGTFFLDGFGDITCNGLAQTAINGLLTEDTCPIAESLAQQEECCNCWICGQIGEIPYRFFDIPVYSPIGGNVTCGDIETAVYEDALYDTETCPLVGEAISRTCCTGDCDICGPDALIPIINENTTLTIPGYGETTCGRVRQHAYLSEDIFDTNCVTISEAAREPCCTANPTFCDVCGSAAVILPGNYDTMVMDPVFGNVTCEYISNLAYFSSDVDSDVCDALQSSTAATLCCESLLDEECLICGPRSQVAYPDLNITFPDGYSINCAALGYFGGIGFLNSTYCPYYIEQGAPCCAPVEACDICSGANGFAFPDLNVTTASGDSMNCADINQLSQEGFSSADCAYYTALAVPCCAIEEVTATPAPVETPAPEGGGTDEPTIDDQPTASPGVATDPTEAPVEGDGPTEAPVEVDPTDAPESAAVGRKGMMMNGRGGVFAFAVMTATAVTVSSAASMIFS